MFAGTTPGQDLNLSLERVTANRNFTNKLWNAAKFVLMNLEDVSEEGWRDLAAADFSASGSLEGLKPADAWIISSLHQASLFSFVLFWGDMALLDPGG